MQKWLFLFMLMFVPIAAHAQQKVFIPTCGGTNDTTALANIITTIGSNQGTIQLPYKAGTRCAVNNLIIPSNVTLDNTSGTGIKVNSGQTLTVHGKIINPQGRALFYNATPNQATGVVVLDGVDEVDIQWWGICGGLNDSNLFLAGLSTGKRLLVSGGVTCASNGVTLSTGVRVDKALIKPLNGQTITITGTFDAPSEQVFTNALQGEGTISFAGNSTGNLLTVRQIWWGTSGLTALPYASGRTSATTTIVSPRVAIEAPLDITRAANFTVQPGAGAVVSSSGEIALQGTFWRGSGTSRYLKAIQTIAQVDGTLALSGALSCAGDATDPQCLNRVVGVESIALVNDDAQVPWAMAIVAQVDAFNSATALPSAAAIYADVSAPNTITNAYGMIITASNGTNATHAYGVRVNGVASAADPFGFYSAGTWPNFFGGPLQLGGSASGKVTVQTAAAAGTWSLTVPTSAGTASGVLTTDGAGVTTWATPGLLSTTAAVNMNTGTATTLYTCPTGKSCVIREVVVRNASTSLTTASYSFGWTSAAYTDVIANATHTELTGATLLTILPAKAGSTLGASTGTFKVLMNTLQGGAATTTIDVFGYVF